MVMADSSNQRKTAEALNDQELRSFLKRCCLFAVPLLLACGPPVTLLALSGEAFRNIDPVLESVIDK